MLDMLLIYLVLFARLLCASFVDAKENLRDNLKTGLSSNNKSIGISSTGSSYSLENSLSDRSKHFKSNLRSFSKKGPLKADALSFYRQTATAKYVIIVSGILMPGTVYRIVVNLLESNKSIYVNASISRKSKGFEIGTEEIVIAPQSSELLLIKVRLFCLSLQFSINHFINIVNSFRFQKKSSPAIMSS